MNRRAPVALAMVVAMSLGCQRADSSRTSQRPRRVELSVFAASSLLEAFSALEQAFERSHPHIDVRLTFAGSQVLRLQTEMGAEVDVFASANEDHMAALVEAELIADSLPLALNELVVIVPISNPAGIERFEDLLNAKRIVLGADNVPAGVYAQQVLENAETPLGADFVARVRRHIVSRESNVRLVRAKVELGVADAAFVYRTDASASERVRMISIPDPVGVRARYFIGRGSAGAKQAFAEQFIRFSRSPAGQALLTRLGFRALP